MILCFRAFVPVLVHDERSRKTFPRWPRSRNTSFQVIFCWCYVQPCFPDVAVCQQCAKRGSPHELQTSANDKWAMDLEFHVGQVVGL